MPPSLWFKKSIQKETSSLRTLKIMLRNLSYINCTFMNSASGLEGDEQNREIVTSTEIAILPACRKEINMNDMTRNARNGM